MQQKMVYKFHHILRKLSVPQTTPLLALIWQNCLLNENVPKLNFCVATTLFKNSVIIENRSWHFGSLIVTAIYVVNCSSFHDFVSSTDMSVPQTTPLPPSSLQKTNNIVELHYLFCLNKYRHLFYLFLKYTFIV